MRKRAGITLLIVLVFTCFLTGCTSMYDMTEEESDIITRYAAYILARQNAYQKDGLLETDDFAFQEEEPLESEDKEESTGIDEDTQENATEQVSFGAIYGLSEALKISYNRSWVSDYYMEGEYYSVTAEQDKNLLIVEFTVENISNNSIQFDCVKPELQFECSVDGKIWLTEQKSFLTYSLSTYQGELKAGTATKMVLIFQTSLPIDSSVDDIHLRVEKDGSITEIEIFNDEKETI